MVGGFLVVVRCGRFVDGNGLVLGFFVVVVARCGTFFVGIVVIVGRTIVVADGVGFFVAVLFSTISAKSWKLSFSDSTILFTNSPILSLRRSSSINCGVGIS